jgi:hypothetical protein
MASSPEPRYKVRVFPNGDGTRSAALIEAATNMVLTFAHDVDEHNGGRLRYFINVYRDGVHSLHPNPLGSSAAQGRPLVAFAQAMAPKGVEVTFIAPYEVSDPPHPDTVVGTRWEPMEVEGEAGLTPVVPHPIPGGRYVVNFPIGVEVEVTDGEPVVTMVRAPLINPYDRTTRLVWSFNDQRWFASSPLLRVAKAEVLRVVGTMATMDKLTQQLVELAITSEAEEETDTGAVWEIVTPFLTEMGYDPSLLSEMVEERREEEPEDFTPPPQIFMGAAFRLHGFTGVGLVTSIEPRKGGEPVITGTFMEHGEGTTVYNIPFTVAAAAHAAYIAELQDKAEEE